jgi:hypothetical protein
VLGVALVGFQQPGRPTPPLGPKRKMFGVGSLHPANTIRHNCDSLFFNSAGRTGKGEYPEFAVLLVDTPAKK